jgi:hypothetical protein
VANKKGTGNLSAHREARIGGTSESPSVAKQTKARDQRVNPKATNPAKSNKVHMTNIIGLVFWMIRIVIFPSHT